MPTYLITGASKGLGLELATQLSSTSSNTVLATSRRPSPALSSLKESHSNLHPITIDVSDVDSVRSRLHSEVSKILGSDTKLDFLLNSAGINSHNGQGVMEIDPAVLVEHVKVNVQAAAETVRALEPLLREGSVVMNMTSGVASLHRMKHDKFGVGASYAISKAALDMLGVMQANHLEGKGVRVIVMDPGHVKTDMGGAHAPLEPKESVEGMLKVLGGLGKGDTARFYQYDGAEVRW